jgi:hypothetical protein
MTPQAIRCPPETPDPVAPGIPGAVQADDHRAAAGVEGARYYVETAQPITRGISRREVCAVEYSCIVVVGRAGPWSGSVVRA